MAAAKKSAPAKKAASKKPAATSTPAKKTPTKTTAAKKSPAKKAAAKPVAKKTPAKKTAAKQTAAKQAPAKKTAATSTAAKKSAAKQSPANKAPAKKSAAKKAPAKNAAATTPRAATKKTAATTAATPTSTTKQKAAATKVPDKPAATKKIATLKKPAAKPAVKRTSAPGLLSNDRPEVVEIPPPRGTTKDGITYTKDFDVKFLKAQREELIARRESELKRAMRLEDEAESLIEDGEMGDVQFDDEGGEGDTMVVQRDLDRVLSSQARQTVEEIDAALLRIEQGTYGYSEISGQPIPRERLEALPETTVLAAEKVSGIARR